jgi:hypothetical protein
MNMKEILKQKDFFKCTGFSELTVTKDGVKNTVKIPIETLGMSFADEFKKHFKAPEAPRIHKFVNMITGKNDKAGAPNVEMIMARDTEDKNYLKEKEEYDDKITYATIMYSMGMQDEYGFEKLEEFKQDLMNTGIGYDQIKKIADDINFLKQKEDEKNDE